MHEKAQSGKRRHRRSRLKDAAIGLRMRALRKARHLSLEKVANKLGISYQQVQKYEAGSNRISSGRLIELSEILDVDVCEFFVPVVNLDSVAPPPDIALIAEAHEIVSYFMRIVDADRRRQALAIVACIANEAVSI